MSRPPLSLQPLPPRNARRRRLVLAALGIPALAGIAGCGGGHDDRPADPLLRFINGTRDVTLASFYVDDPFATSLNLGGIGSIYGELSRTTPAALLPADTVWHLAVVPRAAGSDRVNIAAIRERGDGQTWTA